MTLVDRAPRPPARPRPQRAIDARRRTAEAKVAAVEKVVKALGRTGAPVTRAGVAQLAGVSRSFTYENAEARTLIAAAQARARAGTATRVETLTAQQEASWRERALNGDLMGRLREPDGTWLEQERDRLRAQNELLLSERNQLVRDRDDLRRRLDGARSQVSRLNERRVAELFPGGPGPTAGQPS